MLQTKQFVFVLAIIAVMVVFASAIPSVTFENKSNIADKINVMQFKFGVELNQKDTHQFGHKSLCTLLRDANEYTVDIDINFCYVEASIVGHLTLPKSDDDCSAMGPGAVLAFSFVPSVTTISADATILCVINYAVTPTIGKSDTETIYYRSVIDPDDQTIAPVELTNNFPIIKATDDAVKIEIQSVDFVTSSITYEFTLSAAGSYPITFSSTPKLTNFYCYKAQDDSLREGRFYQLADKSIYLHQAYHSTFTASPLICTLYFSVPNVTTITTSIGEVSIGTFIFDASEIGETIIEVAEEADTAPTFADVSFRFFVPAGTPKDARFSTSLVEMIKTKAAKVGATPLLETYAKGFKYQEVIPNFDYINGDKYEFGITYTGDAPTDKDQIIAVKLRYDEKSFPAQADILVKTTYTGLPTEVNEKYKTVLQVIQDKTSVMYLRAVLRNKITRYELIDNGYSLAVTSQITAHLNTMDFEEHLGWLTIFYMTDSYNDVERDYTCKLTRGKITSVPETFVDFGTLHVFSKEVLKPQESISISCTLPLLYKDLTGYVPAPDARKLRVATWSYDKTTADGADLFEGNNSHSIQPLVPKEAEHVPVAVFSFMVPSYATDTEPLFINLMSKVLKIMAELKDKDSQEPIFSPGDLHSESVYSILNYQLRNSTGFIPNPYAAAEVNSLLAESGLASLAVDTDKKYTVAYYQDFIDQFNTALRDLGVKVASIGADRAYVASSGLANCGSPMARKCLFDGVATQHSCCGGNGEATQREDGSVVCWNSGVTYNPFSNNSYAISITFTLILALFTVFFM